MGFDVPKSQLVQIFWLNGLVSIISVEWTICIYEPKHLYYENSLLQTTLLITIFMPCGADMDASQSTPGEREGYAWIMNQPDQIIIGMNFKAPKIVSECPRKKTCFYNSKKKISPPLFFCKFSKACIINK